VEIAAVYSALGDSDPPSSGWIARSKSVPQELCIWRSTVPMIPFEETRASRNCYDKFTLIDCDAVRRNCIRRCWKRGGVL